MAHWCKTRTQTSAPRLRPAAGAHARAPLSMMALSLSVRVQADKIPCSSVPIQPRQSKVSPVPVVITALSVFLCCSIVLTHTVLQATGSLITDSDFGLCPAVATGSSSQCGTTTDPLPSPATTSVTFTNPGSTPTTPAQAGVRRKTNVTAIAVGTSVGFVVLASACFIAYLIWRRASRAPRASNMTHDVLETPSTAGKSYYPQNPQVGYNAWSSAQSTGSPSLFPQTAGSTAYFQQSTGGPVSYQQSVATPTDDSMHSHPSGQHLVTPTNYSMYSQPPGPPNLPQL
jgi:hypothetical protein